MTRPRQLAPIPVVSLHYEGTAEIARRAREAAEGRGFDIDSVLAAISPCTPANRRR